MATVRTGQTNPSLELALRHRAELSAVIRELRRAIAGPAHDLAWRVEVTQRLAALRTAFAEHIEVTEGTDGLYAELLEHAPRLASGVRVLLRQHVVLRQAINALCLRIPGAAPDEVRDWTEDLLRDLGRHRQRGADLVYEAYDTDIGGET